MSVEMKDSGIAWIGKIPKSWEVKRIKNEAVLNPTLGSHSLGDNDLVSFMPMEFLRNGIIKHNVGRYSDVCKYTPFKEEDIVLAKVTPCFENGNIAIARGLTNRIGFGSSEIFVVRCKNSVNNDFVYYYLQTPYVVNLGISSMTGTGGLKRVNPNVLQCMALVCPPVEEQSRIANFLDKKCAETDELIALQEQMIVQLTTYKQAVITESVTKGLDPNVKMKDSGVEWIGEIPEHWDIAKLKNICSFHNGDRSHNYPSPEDFVEYGIPFYGADSLNNLMADLKVARYISEEKYNSMGGLKIEEGDILYTLRGSTIGKNAIVMQSHGTTASSLMGIRVKNDNAIPTFLLFWFHSICEYSQRDVCINGSTAPNLSAEDVKEFIIFLPSREEQQSIANYLDQKCKEIDELISIKKEKIEKLKAYKKSVIYEYVTGKKQII